MTTDITELAQSLKNAASKALIDEGMTWFSEEQLSHEDGIALHKADAEFIALANPANVLALAMALETKDADAEWMRKRIAELAKERETKEEQRANWFQMAQKLGEDLDVAEKRNSELVEALEKAQQRIDELENDEVRQRLANAEHQLYMAELAKNNLRASRKAQFRKRKAAEQRIAELESRTVTVKLPQRLQPGADGWDDWYVHSDDEGEYLKFDDVLAMLTAAGIKVEVE